MKKMLLVLPLAFLFAGACGAAEEIEEEIDCASICQRYADCFDADYDISECRDSCEDQVDNGDVSNADLDQCDECIDDRSCTDATFSCAGECASILL